MTTLPPSSQQAAFRGIVAGLMILLGVGVVIAGAGFPYNAPVEQIYNFGLAFDLIVGGIILGIFALLAARRSSVPTKLDRVSPLAITAAVLVAVAFVAWAISAPLSFVGHLGDDSRQRYMELAGGLFLAGIPWGGGLVFAAVSYRHPHRVSRILALAAIAVGLVLAVLSIIAAGFYSAGLTD